MEEKVKEEVEEKVKEEVEEKVTGAGEWLRVFLGGRAFGAIMDLPWDPAVLAGPHPPNLNHSLLVSPIWTLRFLMHRVHHKILGQGRWVWADGGGSTRTNQGGPQVPSGGNQSCLGGRGGKRPPLPTRWCPV